MRRVAFRFNHLFTLRFIRRAFLLTASSVLLSVNAPLSIPHTVVPISTSQSIPSLQSSRTLLAYISTPRSLPLTIVPLSVPVPTSTHNPPQKSLVALAALLFAIGAALASAETAITTLWPWKVRELAEREGPKSPFAALEADLTRFLTTILVSTTSATVFSTAIATELAGHVFGASAVAYVTAGLTVVFLFIGEILPKALAVHAPAKVARIMVPVISTLSVIVYPVGKLLAWLSTQILRLLNLPMESNAKVSEEELRLIVAGADRSGSIEKYESQIIHNVLDLEDTDVREIMCPRVDMVAISSDYSLSKLLALEAESRYSRMPVYEDSVDNIVGVAMAKSLLRYLKEDAELLDSTMVSEIMDPPFFVPESMSVWIALEEMRKRRLHMAIVVDEYGGTAGLITLEDILEEVVGEIYDEDDDYEAESSLVKKGDDGQLIIDGQADLEKVGKALDMELTEEDLHDFGTISGFLVAQMGGIPDVDDVVRFKNIKFTVTEADDRRIKSVRAELLSEEELAKIMEEEREKEKAEEMDNGLGELGELVLLKNGMDDSPSSAKRGGNGSATSNGVGGMDSDEFPLRKLFSGIVGGDEQNEEEKVSNDNGSKSGMHGGGEDGSELNKHRGGNGSEQ